MSVLAMLAVVVVALLHVGFLVIEMFLWTKPFGLKAFKLTPEFADMTKVMAANQGLYNGILAAGLFWSLANGMTGVVQFFLLSIVVAGVYGSVTFSPKILWVQAAPAAVALLLTLF